MSRVLKVCQREGNILSDIIREAWDSGNLRTMTRGDPLKVDGAHIGIIGHITRDELLRYLRDTEMANGFGNRMMWVCVKRSKILPFGGDMEAGALDKIRNRTSSAIEGVIARRVNWEPAAAKRWGGVYEKLSSCPSGLVGAMLGRSEAQVVRLATLQALLNGEHQIRLADLEAALALWDYCDQSVKYIFGTLTGNQLADRIYKIICDMKRASKSDIYSGLGCNVRAPEIGEATAILIDAELIAEDHDYVNGSKRATTIYSPL